MHRSRTSIDIPASPDAVFDYVATPRHWPTFWPLTLGVSGAVNVPLRTGDQCVEQARILGWRGAFHWTAVEVDRPGRVVMRGYSRQAGAIGSLMPENPSEIVYTLEAIPSGTRFHREMTYADSNLLIKAADWLGFGRTVDEFAGIALRAVARHFSEPRLGASPCDVLAPDLLQRGDAEGDAPVASLIDATGNVDAVRRLLGQIRSDTFDAALPDPIREYVERTSALPPWADADRIAVSGRVFEEWGLLTLATLAGASLPATYCVPGIARVLNLTGQLDADRRHANRRLMFTTRMVFDVMRSGGLTAGGTGVRAAQRVRLLHAVVRVLLRHRVRGSGRVERAPSDALWQASLDEPINQMELLFTLHTFGWLMVLALERFGCELTPFQRDSYVHTWNVVGSLLGISDELLPVDAADAERQFALLCSRYVGASPEAIRLTAALLVFWTHLFPLGTRWAARRVMHGVMSTLLTPDMIRLLGAEHLPSVPLSARLLLEGVGRLQMRLSGDAFADFPPVAAAAARFMQLGLTLATSREEGLGGLFDIPEELASQWRRV